MKTLNAVLFLILFLMITSTSTVEAYREYGLDIVASYNHHYDRSGPLHYNYRGGRKAGLYGPRHYYYRNYYYPRRPVRYQLPWNRPPIKVKADITGGIKFYRAIPPIIVDKTTPRPTVLVQRNNFKTRHEFLIDTVLRRPTRERIKAAEELSEYKQITSVAALVYVLFNDRSEQVQAAAAESLGEIGIPAAYEPLLRSAECELNDQVRESALLAAEEIEQNNQELIRVEVEVSRLQHGTQRLSEYLEDLRLGRAEIRQRAVKKLSKFRDERSVSAIINSLVNDSDRYVRKEAAQSLTEIGDKMSIPFLQAARVNDVEKSVRQAADKAVETM